MKSLDWTFLNRDIVYLLSCFRFDIKSLTFEGEQDEQGIKDAAANSECPMECACGVYLGHNIHFFVHV